MAKKKGRPVRQMHGRFFRPEIFKDSELTMLELRLRKLGLVRFILMGVWALADRNGRFRWDEIFMRREILPELPFEEFAEVLAELCKGRWLCRYGEEGESAEGAYGHVRTWSLYQTPYKYERASILPQCPVCAHDAPEEKEPEKQPEETTSAKPKPAKKTEPECERCWGKKEVFLPDPRPMKIGVGKMVPCPLCCGGTVTQAVFYERGRGGGSSVKNHQNS